MIRSSLSALSLGLASAALLTACPPPPVDTDAGVDAGDVVDAGDDDAGDPDSGTPDAGEPDGGTPDAGDPDSGTPDAGEPDAGEVDSGTPDAGEPDAGEIDAGEPDAGEPDAGEPDAGEPDGGTPVVDVDDQIAAVIAAADGAVDIEISPVGVTTLRPAIGSDPAGFFIQNSQGGPAVFVAVDPASLNIQAGDLIALTATAKETVTGQPRITAIEDFGITNGFVDVEDLREDLSNKDDVVSNLDAYTNEAFLINGTIRESFRGAGNGHVAATFDTAGLVGSPDLRLRLPTTIQTEFDDNLAVGCSFTVRGAMWRFNTVAQPSAWSSDDVVVNSCPAPAVVSAGAVDNTTVVLTFDRNLNSDGIDAADFTLDNGATVNSVVVNGKQITLTTSALIAGVTYTVTVGNGVTDTRGSAVAAGSNTASFSIAAGGQLVINEIDYDQATDNGEFVEIVNIGAADVNLAGLVLVGINGSNNTEYVRVALSGAGTLAPGGILVVGTTSMSALLPAGVSFVPFAAATDNIQNGAPDAIIILDTNTNTVLEGLAYEGAMPAATYTGGTIALEGGFSTTLADLNAGAVADPSTSASICRSPNGTGAYALCAASTPGRSNP